MHRALLSALPQDIILWGTTVTSVEQESGSKYVVQAEAKQTGSGSNSNADGVQRITVECDLVIAADGSMSDTRRRFRPDESRR